ncbi:MAG: DUF1211 domain-containing protein [Methanosphaera stadtmanae]|nr:DUF1211 domain-containing protein [Methanosphaera stadtmanae]
MDSGRFETFMDAILAIMMTVMVLKIPQPETLSLEGILSLRHLYFAYAVSFITLFSVWDHHRRLFAMVDEINNRVVWVTSLLIYVLTFFPYFTAWVAHYPNELVPELCFGLIFIIVNVLYVYSTRIVIKYDVHNADIQEVNFRELSLINFIVLIAGFVLSIMGLPNVMMIACFITIITWNIIPYIKKTYYVGDNNGN